MSRLCFSLRQGFIMEFSDCDRIAGEIELILPPERKPRFGDGRIPIQRAGLAFRQVWRIHCDFVWQNFRKHCGDITRIVLKSQQENQ